MPNRARDWFEQAERNMDQARASQAEGRHEWACFAAQQAAELAAKAMHLASGQEAWGQIVSRLLPELPFPVPEELVEKAKVRYPNGHSEGAPYQHYGIYQSEEAVRHTGEIVAFIGARLAEPRKD